MHETTISTPESRRAAGAREFGDVRNVEPDLQGMTADQLKSQLAKWKDAIHDLTDSDVRAKLQGKIQAAEEMLKNTASNANKDN